MQITILTLFPEMFVSPLCASILKRAQASGKVDIRTLNIRDFSQDKHHTTDLPPYGGGPGMVMMIEPIHRALESLSTSQDAGAVKKIVLLSAKGKPYTQATARSYSQLDHLVLICGHYEGVDERVATYLADEEIRVGDVVLTGGEIPALAVTDSVVRLLPGVLGDETSTQDESHSVEGVLEYPQYTRPAQYNGWKVPKLLLGGNHALIQSWREHQKQSG